MLVFQGLSVHNLLFKKSIVFLYFIGTRKSVAPQTREEINASNHQLDSFFEIRSLPYRRENSESKVSEIFYQPTVVCNDLPTLVNEIIVKRARQDTESLLVKVSIDGGGGFLKFCLSIFDINNPQPKEGKYFVTKKFLESGVKKIFIIGIVPEVKEEYVNVKRLWLNSGLDQLERKFTVATDLKLCNILLGMMNHSSAHPCA